MARLNDPNSADRPFLGMVFMFGFCLLAPLGDGMAKLLGDSVPLLQLVAMRFGVQALVLLPLAIWTGRTLAMSPRLAGLVVARTVLHILGIGMMFLSLRYLELADAIAIAFVMPFLMLALGWAVLGEHVGPWRLGGCIVGFLGTLLVIQPSFAEVGAPALLPLGVAVAFSCFMLVTRLVAKALDPGAMQGVSGGMALLVLLPVMALAAGSDAAELAPRHLTGAQWGLMVALGLLGTLAHLLMTWSLRYAPSATLAPMQYLEIPCAVLVGWALFGDLPDGLAAFGICIVIAAGLFNVWREHAAGRRAGHAPPPQAPPAA